MVRNSKGNFAILTKTEQTTTAGEILSNLCRLLWFNTDGNDNWVVVILIGLIGAEVLELLTEVLLIFS